MHLAQGVWSEDVCSRKMASFTALNGAEAKSPDSPSANPVTQRANSEEERPGNQVSPSEPQGAEAMPTSQREQWAGRGAEGSSYPPPSYPEGEESHKRKRSNSPEPSRETQSTREQQVESRDAFLTPQRDRDYRHFGEEKRDSHEMWYAQQGREERTAYDQQNSAGPAPSQTDEQLGEPIRRGASLGDSQEYPATSPDGEDSGMYGGPYTPDGHRDTVIQSDPKKRKRNFSNRTKTGCLTCRKRKKKCDETKPECPSPNVSDLLWAHC